MTDNFWPVLDVGDADLNSRKVAWICSRQAAYEARIRTLATTSKENISRKLMPFDQVGPTFGLHVTRFTGIRQLHGAIKNAL